MLDGGEELVRRRFVQKYCAPVSFVKRHRIACTGVKAFQSIGDEEGFAPEIFNCSDRSDLHNQARCSIVKSVTFRPD